jgi:molybdate transport system permease protein
MDWGAIILTFKLAFVTSLILFFLAMPIAYYLAYSKSKLKPVIETLVSMPLVLPPTVLGFYLLLIFSPSNAFGNWIENTIGFKFVFSFPGLVLGSLIYSLPFMVHPIQSGLVKFPANLIEASYVLGKSKWETFRRILLPNIKPSLLTGIILSFAHTIGEFGVVLMIGGNIPGKTKVASIAIYDEVEAMNYNVANQYSLILFIICFLILLLVYLVNGGYLKNWWK